MLASWEVGAKREGGSVRGVCVCLYTCVCYNPLMSSPSFQPKVIVWYATAWTQLCFGIHG